MEIGLHGGGDTKHNDVRYKHTQQRRPRAVRDEISAHTVSAEKDANEQGVSRMKQVTELCVN